MTTPTDTAAEAAEAPDPYAELSSYQRAEPPMHQPRLCVCGEWSWDLRTGRCLECRCTIAGLPGAPPPMVATTTVVMVPEAAPAPGQMLPVRIDGQTSTAQALVLAVDVAEHNTHAVVTLAVCG